MRTQDETYLPDSAWANVFRRRRRSRGLVIFVVGGAGLLLLVSATIERRAFASDWLVSVSYWAVAALITVFHTLYTGRIFDGEDEQVPEPFRKPLSVESLRLVWDALNDVLLLNNAVPLSDAASASDGVYERRRYERRQEMYVIRGIFEHLHPEVSQDVLWGILERLEPVRLALFLKSLGASAPSVLDDLLNTKPELFRTRLIEVAAPTDGSNPDELSNVKLPRLHRSAPQRGLAWRPSVFRSPKYFHQAWTNLVGSVTGWGIGYILWKRSITSVASLGPVEFVLFLLAIIGIMGYLPIALQGFIEGLAGLAEKTRDWLVGKKA